MTVAALAASMLLAAGAPSEICDVNFVEKLAPGSYSGGFFQLANAKGGANLANMEVQVHVKGDLVLEVDEDGVITSASSPKAQWVLLGVGQLKSGKSTIFSGMNGYADGPLTMTTGSAQAATLTGDVKGSAAAFIQIERDKVTWPGPAIGGLEVQLKATHPFCSRSSGDMSSKAMDETVAALAAKGFSTEVGRGGFSLKGPPQLQEREQEVKKRMDQAAQWAKGGGEDPKGARAWPLFAAAAQSILRERSEITRFCLALVYRRPAGDALRDRLAAVRRELDAVEPSPSNLGLIRMGIDDLMELDRHIVELALDSCSAKLHQEIFDAAVAKLDAVIDRAVKERVIPGDLSEILRNASVTGKIAPGLRDKAAAAVREHAARAKGG